MTARGLLPLAPPPRLTASFCIPPCENQACLCPCKEAPLPAVTRKQKQEEAQEATGEEGLTLSFMLQGDDGVKAFWGLKMNLRSPFLNPSSPVPEVGPSPLDGDGQEEKKKK